MRRDGTQPGNPPCVLQTSVVVFRELCGVSAVANLMQCVLALGSRVSGPDEAPLLLFDLGDLYPGLEPQGPLPEVLRRLVATYDMVRGSRRRSTSLFLLLSSFSSSFPFIYFYFSPFAFSSTLLLLPPDLHFPLLLLHLLSAFFFLPVILSPSCPPHFSFSSASPRLHPLSIAEPPGGRRLKYIYRL